jgi:hypothetical protein
MPTTGHVSRAPGTGIVALRSPARAIVVVAAVLGLAGCRGPRPCAAPQVAAAPALVSPANAWAKTELFLGLVRRDGGAVSDADFDAFAEDVVAAEFPDGFTVLRGDGRYRDAAGKVYREPSRVLVVVSPRERFAAHDASVVRIADKYVRRFDQESVLRVDSDVRATFLAGSATR